MKKELLDELMQIIPEHKLYNLNAWAELKGIGYRQARRLKDTAYTLLEIGDTYMPKEKSSPYICHQEDMEAFVAELCNALYLYLDIESTPGFDPLERGFKVRLITIGDGNRSYTFDTFKLQDISPVLELIKNKPIIAHNAKFEVKAFYHRYGILPQVVFDTMVATQIIAYAQGKRESCSLENVANQYLGISMDRTQQASNWGAPQLSEEQIKYALADADVLPRLTSTLVGKLNELDNVGDGNNVLGLRNRVAILEMAFVPEVAKLELAGLPIDTMKLEQTLIKAKEEFREAYTKFEKDYGANPRSPQQVKQVLEKSLGASLPNTSDSTLAPYAGSGAVNLLLKVRKLDKLQDKLGELQTKLKDHHVHGEFWSIGTVTGRMSSHNPNMQNIARSLSDLIRPQPGRVLLKADFPAIQLRIAAKLAPDLALQEAFQTGQDPHRLTASTILGKPLAEIDLKDRQKAKAVNFGFTFGMGWKGLMDYACTTYGVKMSESDARNYRGRFFTIYQGITHWHQDLKAELNAKGEVETISIIGRKAKASSLYTASNYCIQGSEADILKLAVLRVSENLVKAGLDTQAQIVNLVHDSIWVETSEFCTEQVGKLLQEAMRETAEELLELPTPVE